MARYPKGSTNNLTAVKKKRPYRAGHALYCRADSVKIDGRTHFARQRRKLKESFLEGFDSPSPRLQALADGAAVNWILLEVFRSSFLKGTPVAPSVWKDFCAIQNSLDRTLTNLEAMAKESGNGAKTLSLDEYLAAMKAGKLIPVEAEKVPPAEEKPRERTTLF